MGDLDLSRKSLEDSGFEILRACLLSERWLPCDEVEVVDD